MIGGKEATRYYTEAIIFCTTGLIVSSRLVFWPNEFGPTGEEIWDISGSDADYLAVLKISIVYTVLAVARFQYNIRISIVNVTRTGAVLEL